MMTYPRMCWGARGFCDGGVELFFPPMNARRALTRTSSFAIWLGPAGRAYVLICRRRY